MNLRFSPDEAPIIAWPEEFNRILIVLNDAGPAGLFEDSWIDVSSSHNYQSQMPDHAATIRAAQALEFVAIRKGKYVLTSLGKRFLQFNPGSTYELAPGQAKFFIEACVISGGYRSHAKALFALFTRRGKNRAFSLDIATVALNQKQRSLIALLRRLGAVRMEESFVIASDEFTPKLSATRSRRKITVAELEMLLTERSIRGAAAELWVARFEQDRLKRAGCDLEASAVSVIADLDVAAGYDIESFDGRSADLRPDRFIEVKSTASEEPVFFWSENERATATDLGSQYWIYHLRAFDAVSQAAELTQIRNPVVEHKRGNLDLRAASFKATFQPQKYVSL